MEINKKVIFIIIPILCVVGCNKKTSTSAFTNSVNENTSSQILSETISNINNNQTSISFPKIEDTYSGTYYNSITDAMIGETLQSALMKIISDTHSSKSYSALWGAYKTTDCKPGTNIIWDMYSNYEFKYGTDQAGNYSKEGDAYNREHSIPQSWFNEANPMVSDVHHIYPTDGYVNGRRSNYPYGEVKNPTYTSENGSKLGPSSFSGFSGTVFEPIDEYKGDFARTYFYFATRYQGAAANGEGSKIFTTSYPYLSKYALNLFTKWSQLDPVSQKEIDRNNAIQAYQGNRNPFIDHPSYIAKIFGLYGTGTSVIPPSTTSSEIGNSLYEICKPIVGEKYKLGFEQGNISQTLWITGTTKSSTPWYLLTTSNFDEACDAYIENANNGYYLCIDVEGKKKYLNIVSNDSHINASIGDNAITIYTYDETYKTFVGLQNNNRYYLGTYNAYNTLSCSSYSQITGVNSYPSHFYKAK